MRRRGPNHAAACRLVTPAGAQVALLNARLKILDLADRANQPMRVGPLVMTYNGELYNHVELRQELSEARERLDFAERLLVQDPESRRMGPQR